MFQVMHATIAAQDVRTKSCAVEIGASVGVALLLVLVCLVAMVTLLQNIKWR